LGLATRGPATEGVVIAVEAGASGAGAAIGGGGTTGTGCCAKAEDAAPSCHAAAAAKTAAPTGRSARKIRFIGFFPQPEAKFKTSAV
jgi:hypothetical protein